MKYVRQFLLILAITFLGEILKAIIPLQIPAGIYGLLLLLILLMTGVIKLSQVKETADFLIEIMPIMFIPAAVGLLDTWDVLQPVWIKLMIITLISTVLVMGVSGLVTQFVMRKGGKKDEGVR
ncbi:MAG: CidA/LrgA family protein [Lachnospiraceae bacterium]|nr:CidA/LrgA family protein [Lachnospiraceae bacterium]